jgi:glycosyltransferase involved in cell wall biosynthesis
VAAIITCSNSQNYIRKTIDSILSQTYPNMDIIAVDDGSTDGTRPILESYAPRIRVLTHKDNKNLGQPASLNRGIRDTDAELIAPIDHDDIWYPHKIQRQVDVFDRIKDVGLVYTNGYAIDPSDKILYKLLTDNFVEKQLPGEILLDCYIPSPSQAMIRADLIHRVGLFREDVLSCSDHDMYVKLSELTKFYYISDCLVGYRQHAGQQSRRRRMWEDGSKVLDDAFRRYPYPKSLRRRRKAVLHFRLGQYDLQHNYLMRGLFHIAMAGAIDPVRASKEFFRRAKD